MSMNTNNNAPIIEGNKLIAEFMELKSCDINYTDFSVKPIVKKVEKGYFIGENRMATIADRLEYHTSWDWLMPVVEKIEAIYDEHDGYYGVHISSNACVIQGTKLHLALRDLGGYGAVYLSDTNAVFSTKIESTWYNVVEFIKWWNQRQNAEVSDTTGDAMKNNS